MAATAAAATAETPGRSNSMASATAAAATAAMLGCSKSQRAEMQQSAEGRTADSPYDVLVIGGGVVGLSIARECAVRGVSVALVEREDDWAAGASSGNSGIGCTGYDAPVGSLERQLLRRSIQRHPELMRSFGLSCEHTRKCGSLVVAWNPDALARLPGVLSENREAGDLEAELLSARALHEREPCLANDAMGAVWCPREAVVEPWLLPHGYAESAFLCGARLMLSTEAVSASYDREARLWCVRTHPSAAAQSGRSPPGKLLVPPPACGAASASAEPCVPMELHARVVINCAGLYGDVVHQWAPVSIGGSGACSTMAADGSEPARRAAEVQLAPTEDPSACVDDAAPFHVTPRKGQFVVLRPAPHTMLPSAVLEQVASQFTKGVIVWQTLYGNVVVGPTAEPQASRDDRTTDEDVLSRLLAHGERCVPSLRGATLLGSFSGLRPATEHRDYQISWTSCDGPAADAPGATGSGWISVAGIRSTGLSCAPGIGEYVAELYIGLRDGRPPVHASACRPADAGVAGVSGRSAGHGQPRPADGCAVGVTEAALGPVPLEPAPERRNGPMPSLATLAAEYRRRGDGRVTLYGKLRRVTHPVTSFGLQTIGVHDQGSAQQVQAARDGPRLMRQHHASPSGGADRGGAEHESPNLNSTGTRNPPSEDHGGTSVLLMDRECY